jgi:hypothetical protein
MKGSSRALKPAAGNVVSYPQDRRRWPPSEQTKTVAGCRKDSSGVTPDQPRLRQHSCKSFEPDISRGKDVTRELLSPHMMAPTANSSVFVRNETGDNRGPPPSTCWHGVLLHTSLWLWWQPVLQQTPSCSSDAVHRRLPRASHSRSASA